jgi:hypothetical protein
MSDRLARLTTAAPDLAAAWIDVRHMFGIDDHDDLSNPGGGQTCSDTRCLDPHRDIFSPRTSSR